MSLIDRVRYLAGGITVWQARNVVAEVYRKIGEGTLANDNPHDLAMVLIAHANGLIQQNAVDTLGDVGPLPSLLPERLLDPDVDRLERAREALVATGYFTPEQVGDDIAARITELFSVVRPVELCNLAAWRSINAPGCARPRGHDGKHMDQAAIDSDGKAGTVWGGSGDQELPTGAGSRAGMLCGRCEHEMPPDVVHQHDAVIANNCGGCAACSAGREVGWRP